jgi:uncharacterized protein (DUF169 family)
MDAALQTRFLTLWRRYFNNAEIPIVFSYSESPGDAQQAGPGTPRCVVNALRPIREGASLACDAQTVGCPGGRRYLGFADSIATDFEYFLSYGIPGKVRGERYAKSPELVKHIMAQAPAFKAPARYIVFKRWDKLAATDSPDVVIFFATPDVLAGLYTLARFDNAARDAVATPFGAGCSTIVQYPYQEKNSEEPRAIIGTFDPSARPWVPANTLSFAVPFHKFVRMVNNMEESFLITDTWQRIRSRIA